MVKELKEGRDAAIARERARRWYQEKGRFRRSQKGTKTTQKQYKCVLCGFYSNTLERFNYHEPEIILKQIGGRADIKSIGKEPPTKEYVNKVKKAIEETYEELSK